MAVTLAKKDASIEDQKKRPKKNIEIIRLDKVTRRRCIIRSSHIVEMLLTMPELTDEQKHKALVELKVELDLLISPYICIR